MDLNPAETNTKLTVDSKNAPGEGIVRFSGSTRSDLARLAVLLLAALLAFTAETRGVPITYTLEVYRTPGVPSGTSPSGKLGAISFGGSNGDVILTFTFEGDTANVIPFTTTTTPPASGFEILIGVASVEVKDANSGVISAQGIFSPSAGIFVSVDNTNHGMGFGSFGTLAAELDVSRSSGVPLWHGSLLPWFL
jgi:hypothetical protein